MASLERMVERRLARLLWRRGWRVRVLAFTSYGVVGEAGAPGWMRLIGQALLADITYLDQVVVARLAAGWHGVALLAAHGEVATARVRMVGANERDGVVSDIDDTVIITALPRPLLALLNTFVRHESARRPVPGIADLFGGLPRGTAADDRLGSERRGLVPLRPPAQAR